jgi:hypothetical protein
VSWQLCTENSNKPVNQIHNESSLGFWTIIQEKQRKNINIKKHWFFWLSSLSEKTSFSQLCSLKIHSEVKGQTGRLTSSYFTAHLFMFIFPFSQLSRGYLAFGLQQKSRVIFLAWHQPSPPQIRNLYGFKINIHGTDCNIQKLMIINNCDYLMTNCVYLIPNCDNL